ncbi:sigma-70 family RNA polymerase sigma factor [uncultured Polaribacter sp.]|uniref:RNA polymerase sigma factor n=1 Tax=uncultured Polaribacter sp. TaxID=174711 RepID=UPI00263829B6|nr:sigma-70 family RNA polymerase sigma factor [uncultured Polaribacter sp.]
MKLTNQLHQPIIDKCKNNCAKSQMQLYNLYCKAMIIVANRYVKDSFLAEDVMQDAFIKAFKNIDSYKNEVAFGVWLKKIVINQSIDYLKKNRLELVAIDDEIITNTEDDWQIESTISIDIILETIHNLKEKYRLVLTMYLLEGFDHQEIAEVLNISENTSRTHLFRGKKILKEQLQNTSYAGRY